MNFVDRIFIPGSSCVYFKLYASNKTIDDILKNNIPLLVEELLAKNYICKWFFVRYSDPELHLRIRFFMNDKSFIGDLILLFYKHFYCFVECRLVNKIQLDTYKRELERYNPLLIEETEMLFYYDSLCILDILILLKNSESENNNNYRWMIALVLIDHILDCFQYSLPEKLSLLTIMSDSFKHEFGFNKYNSKQFKEKFRVNKVNIELIMLNKYIDSTFLLLTDVVKKYFKDISSTLIILKEKAKVNHIDIDILLPNYIHMTMNRLFFVNSRKYELIVYDFMKRYYHSMIVRMNID